MTTARLIPQERPQMPELVAIAESDLAEVAQFVASQSGRDSGTVESHLQWFLLANPARQPQQPVGFSLRSSGEFVGCILCSPQGFQCRNQSILMMGSSLFYVDERHRGQGGRIFLQYSRLGNRWPLFGTSANPESATLWKAAGASPLPYSDGELFGVLNWPPVAEELAHRRNATHALSRLAASPISNLLALFSPLKIDQGDASALQLLTSAEQANDLIVHDPSQKLTAMRDPAYIRWRYFSGRDATTAVFAFRSTELSREVLVTVNQRRRGYRSQINTLNLLDVYPEVGPEVGLRIVGALVASYSKDVDVIVLRGQDPEMRKIFCEKGFRWRAFDAPIGWYLDRAKLLPASDWYAVPADGDGLI